MSFIWKEAHLGLRLMIMQTSFWKINIFSAGILFEMFQMQNVLHYLPQSDRKRSSEIKALKWPNTQHSGHKGQFSSKWINGWNMFRESS